MAKPQKITVSTTEAIVAAMLAFERNGNTIVRRNDEGKPDNKQLIVDYFVRGEKATPELEEKAIVLKNALDQRITLNAITGAKSNDFLVTITNLFKEDKISNFDFGLLAWAPKLFHDLSKADDVRESMLRAGASSKYIGQIGKRTNINLTVTSCRYLNQYNSFIHQGMDDNGNIVLFFNKEKIESGNITARIKAHRKDERLSNALVTVINYVKKV